MFIRAAIAAAPRRPLGAEYAVQQEPLAQLGEMRVARPQERGARDLERVVLCARLLRLDAVEQLRAQPCCDAVPGRDMGSCARPQGDVY